MCEKFYFLFVRFFLFQDAITLARMVGYVSAGTVEYLYMPETNEYFFLELNPRLQVSLNSNFLNVKTEQNKICIFLLAFLFSTFLMLTQLFSGNSMNKNKFYFKYSLLDIKIKI